MYYLRTRPAADAVKFTVDKQVLKSTAPVEGEKKRKADDKMLQLNGHPVEKRARPTLLKGTLKEQPQPSATEPTECLMCSG